MWICMTSTALMVCHKVTPCWTNVLWKKSPRKSTRLRASVLGKSAASQSTHFPWCLFVSQQPCPSWAEGEGMQKEGGGETELQRLVGSLKLLVLSRAVGNAEGWWDRENPGLGALSRTVPSVSGSVAGAQRQRNWSQLLRSFLISGKEQYWTFSQGKNTNSWEVKGGLGIPFLWRAWFVSELNNSAPSELQSSSTVCTHGKTAMPQLPNP